MEEAKQGYTLEEARARVLSALSPLPGDDACPLQQARGRVLAAPLVAPRAVPGFRASSMDGYALRAVDGQPGQSLPVVGCSAAGAPYGRPLQAGQAVRIFTGAVVPDGADAVVPQEDIRLMQVQGDLPGPAITLEGSIHPGQWIRSPQEEAAAGEPLGSVGQRLSSVDVARASGCGLRTAQVYARPRVALLITGSELRPAGHPLAPGSIYDSNGPLLLLLLEQLGVAVVGEEWVDDDPQRLERALLRLADRSDVLISTGGVSVGAEDHVRPLLERLGALQFWRLFLKPGRPFATGTMAGARFFGLPGNPVSAAVTFLQLVWPALQVLEGATPEPWPRLRVRLATPLRRRSGRPELIRARLGMDSQGSPMATPCGDQSSARLASLQGADLLLEVDAATTALPAGATVMAQLLRLPVL
ncbi:MAG: molybdopterin molybdotransferase MoeA [Synechococcus sp. SB0678_bin_12]|nr:molybdopterin molybdotransferase MoeA [Synechococcus sp. SB0678_bin_12]MYI87071.1 molybdopterin molybdotransferase MoeA [Synechococcus sp. SB0672_bin_10]